ncbi:MAG: OmpH family outer membrane protein [Deltaproteobacteria bacterium]|nr:OmpH family outer membrane protein [Deltaproteobacteria bacterium]
MKKILLFVSALIMIFAFETGPASAQAVKIAVVNLDKFQQTSKTFQKTATVMKKKFEDLQKKLDEERNALAKLEEDFKKQSMMLSLDAQEDKKRELEKKRRYYKYLHDESTQEMKDTEVEAIRKIMNELETVVEKLAEKEGYTLILERRTMGLVYYNKSVDITDRVIEAYDKMYQ